MSAAITHSYFRFGEKPISDGFNVFVESNLTRYIDKYFFDKHEIMGLDFKCRSWSKLQRKIDKIVIAELKAIFGENCNIAFSAKAGCKCGCSPGYKVRGINHPEYNNRAVFVTVDNDIEETKKAVIAAELDLAKELLKR